MSMILRFPPRHVRASSVAIARADKVVSASAVRPEALALSVAKIACHHSDGTLSRCHHLRTVEARAPTSDDMASREGHSSMTERNETKSGMHESMGQIVPNSKAMVSHDIIGRAGHLVPMSKDDETIAETEWREAFRQRVRQAQGNRTQETMAKLLGISRDTYAKYVGARGSVMSPRLLLKFCEICDVKLEWLIEGRQADAPERLTKIAVRPPKIAARR